MFESRLKNITVEIFYVYIIVDILQLYIKTNDLKYCYVKLTAICQTLNLINSKRKNKFDRYQ